ncbi:MAG TPA: MFS transporter [Planctomycetota bacterium]|nr:MFS transporter [Planctomycetota bacterium]
MPREIPASFAALRHRNFRLLWSGMICSTAGSMMQNAAILWHVTQLVPVEKRPLALGAVGMVKIVPIFVFSLAGGVVADALDRKKLMLAMQSLMAIFAAILAVLSFTGKEALWSIYLLTALNSAANTFDGPARQSMIPALVPPKDFANAISLNTIHFQVASVVGPWLSGIVIASLGMGWVYALNAVSFLAVIVNLLRMRNVPPRQGAGVEVSLRSAVEGLRFVFRTPMIRSTMLLDFFATLFSTASGLLPIFAQDILHVGPRGYGFLVSAQAVGALLASAFLVHAADRIDHRGRTLLWAVTAYGLATVVFGLSRSFELTFACLALVGAADMVSTVLRNIIRQLATPDRLRGRMTSVNMMFFMGGPQLGEIEAGLVANSFGAPFSVVTGGIGCLVATAWIAAKTPALRRYRREDPVLEAA